MDRRSFMQKSMGGGILANIPSLVLYAFSKKEPAGIGICNWNLGQSAAPSYTPGCQDLS